jgi:hypothetical protein
MTPGIFEVPPAGRNCPTLTASPGLAWFSGERLGATTPFEYQEV